MKIYMDVCCLNRPFDDLSQARVYLEAEAVLLIISMCEDEGWTLLASSVIDYELSKQSDIERLGNVQTLYAAAGEKIKLTDEIIERAEFFQNNGLKKLDSLHLASADTYKADVFLTTDDRLLKAAKKMNLKILVANPVSWLMEVMEDEK